MSCEIEEYNPCYTGFRMTLKDCYKRANRLADKDSHSGIMCINKDASRVVFLCSELSKLNQKLKTAEEEIKSLKAHEYVKRHG